MPAELLRARAPLRVSFAGGGTDVPPFPSREGGVVLSAAITRYAYGALCPRDDGQIRIESLDLGTAIRFRAGTILDDDPRFELVVSAIRRLHGTDERGFDLFLRCDAPPGSGLGSSSAMMVVLIGLLAAWHRMELTGYEVAELAFDLERRELGILGGHQDQYAAAFGGFNFMEFGEDVVVNPLRVPAAVVLELECNMLLCDTGRTRRSDQVLAHQSGRVEAGEEEVLCALRRQKELATAMKAALLKGRLGEFGALLGEAWRAKQQLSERITTPFIDEAYETAMAHGAVGGKVTGAGGGGHMLLYCTNTGRHRVAKALAELGCTATELSFADAGLTTWRADVR